MGVYIDGTKLEIIETKNVHFHFDLLDDVDKSSMDEINHIIERNESSVKHKIKNEVDQLLYKYKHENDIHEQQKQ